ncbi:glucose transporter [Fusarium agapanthi]|uniref:Glucose transporter n=1 Tax=Fusarium agapanthi TaxID=1803897 RepID=A0A9P5BEH3_9HYPO|nr:glucose transporter [Fusarium agapanthi]
MGSSPTDKKGAAAAAGNEPAAVLPNDARPWYRVPRLLKLNLLLLIPLVSSGAIGYDGMFIARQLRPLTKMHRIDDERSSDPPQWRGYLGQPEGAMLDALNSAYPAGKKDSHDGRSFDLCRFRDYASCLQNLKTFIAARAIIGFFTSFLAQPSPILTTELAYPTHRGKLTALYNTSFYLGGIIAAWCTYGTFKIDSTWSWRIPSLLQGALPFIQLLAVYFLPESPRWLVAHGRREEARKILATYHAGGDANAPLANFEMAEIEGALTHEADAMSQNSWLELVRTPANRKRTLIAVVVGWLAQWNGINLVSYYLVLVLNTIGITAAKEQTLINGLLLGRRTLFLLSTCGMFVSCIIWTAISASFDSTRSPTTGKAIVGFVFITFFFYAIAWAPLLQAYAVEIFPYTLRSRGVSVMYVSTFVGLVGNQVNPIAIKNIGWKYCIVFCCIIA